MATSSALSTSNQYIKYTISVAQNSQSDANNTSNVTISVRFYRTNTGYTTYGTGTIYCKINGTTYSASVTSSQKITENGIVLFTKTLNIPHDDKGEKTLTCSAWISISVLTSSEQSYSQVLTTIPRKSTLTVGEGTLGTAQTLTVTRQSTSFTHTITYVCGNDSGTICTKSSNTSISWTPPLSLGNNAPNGTQATIAITITTYNGDTSVGSNTYSIKANIPESVVPSLTLAVSDAAGHLATYGGYVQGQSMFAVSLTAAGNLNSSIRTYSTTADGKTYTAASFTTPALVGSGSQTINAKVTDSRGRSTEKSTTVTVLPYATPKVSSVSVKRSDASGNANASGDYLAVTFNAAISSLNNKNSAAYSLKYKKMGATAYTTVALSNYAGQYSVTGGSCVFAADTASSYDIVLTATDDFTSSQPVTVTGSSISKLFSWKEAGTGWAFGKVAERDFALDTAWDAYFEKDVNVEGDINAEGVINDKFGTAIGNGLAAYGGGGDEGIDPNTTLESLCLTSHTNAPQGLGTFYYIFTTFYNTKSETAARSQLAFPYNNSAAGSIYFRHYASGAWSSWNRLAKGANDLSDYLPLAGGTMTGDLIAPNGRFTTSSISGSAGLTDDVLGFYSSHDDAIAKTNRRAAVYLTSSNSLILRNESAVAIQISNPVAGVHLSGGSGDQLFRPITTNALYLGGASYKWKSIYAVNGTIQTSDRNQKTNIETVDDRYIALFDKLEPVTFEFKKEADVDSHDRVHIGFISQDVKAAMDEVGLSDLDFAGYCRDVLKEANEETGEEEIVLDENGDPVYVYSLRYSEFIALNSKMIQLNRERIENQQGEIDALRGEVEELKKTVAELAAKL